MNWFVLILPLVYITLGFLLTEKNAPTLMSGYNTLSKEEQAAYPLAKSVRFFRRFHWWMGSVTLAGGLLFLTLGHAEVAVNWVVIFPMLGYVYFVYRSMRFSANSQRNLGWVVLGILVFTIMGVGLLMWYGDRPNQLQLSDDRLVVTGMYGIRLSKAELVSWELADTLPAIRFKQHGFAIGNKRKGKFRTKDGRTLHLLLHERGAPMVHLKTSDGAEIYYQPTEITAAELLEKLGSWRNP